MTMRRICHFDAPSVRSVPSSRVRWATVIDIVLKITNEPTSSASPPEAEQDVADELDEAVDALHVLLGLLVPGADDRRRRNVERSSRTSRRRRTPGLAATETAV